MRIDVELEEWSGSRTIHPVRSDYRRRPDSEFRDSAARLTPRQAIFYRNIVRIAEQVGNAIPVDFNCRGTDVHLDVGCIKIAELAGFIATLENGPTGVVDSIRLTWRTDGTTVAA